MIADGAVLPIHRHAGEVPHVLVGARELVEERRLSAVLVADQGKRQRRPGRERIAGAFGMEAAALAEAGVLGLLSGRVFHLRLRRRLGRLHPDLRRVVQAQRQLVAAEHKLHRVAHGRVFDRPHLRAGDEAHVQKMLAQGSLAADARDDGALSDLQFSQCHAVRLPDVYVSCGIISR